MDGLHRPHLVLMAKPPRAGQVKTRLSADIGAASAVQFYRSAVTRLLRRLGDDPRWRTVLAVNASPTERFAAWPSKLPRMAQGQGSLGDRLNHVLRALPPGPAVIIGTDTPHLEPADIAQAFHTLAQHDAVFGPAEDGGYWLIGMRRLRDAPSLFEGVRWSTAQALADTLASLPPHFTRAMLHQKTDVDTGAELRALVARWGDLRFGPWRPTAAAPAIDERS